MSLPRPVLRLATVAAAVLALAGLGAGIAPGQFQQFTLSAGAFPDKGSFTFNVVQSYSDGTQASWIDPTIAGQPEPEHPAPVLHLSAAGGSEQAASPSPAAATSSSGSGPSGVALFLSILALAVALAAVVLAVLNRRRTVAS